MRTVTLSSKSTPATIAPAVVEQAIVNAAPAPVAPADPFNGRVEAVISGGGITPAEKEDRQFLLAVCRTGRKVIRARSMDCPEGVKAAVEWHLFNSSLYGSEGTAKAKDAVSVASTALVPFIPADVRALLRQGDATDAVITFLRHPDAGWVANVLRFCSKRVRDTEAGFAAFASGLARVEAGRESVAKGMAKSASAQAKAASKAAAA